MPTQALIPLIALFGMALFLIGPGPKFQELGKIMFWVGLSATLFALIR